jgi:integrase
MQDTTTDQAAAAPSGAKTKDQTQHVSADGLWRSFPKVPRLMQYVPSGVYFARLRHKGRLFKRSLETNVFTTAKLKLPDKVKEIVRPKAAVGTFAEARLLLETDLANDHTLKPASKRYRRNCISALLRTWPGLDGEKLPKIKLAACQEWATRFSDRYDEQFYNNTVATFRSILERGGLRHDDNPGFQLDRIGVPPKELTLPEPEQFENMLKAIDARGGRARQSADLARFLAYSGCRISEARLAVWADVDLDRGEIKVRNAKRKIVSSTSGVRYVPIIHEMRELLARLRQEQQPQPTDRICKLRQCQKPLTRACKDVGAARITHHDLRHLFATRCIESGVDIPTVSRWLGHADGGALAMRCYGHLRRGHSQEMARKVIFSQSKPANVVDLPVASVGEPATPGAVAVGK